MSEKNIETKLIEALVLPGAVVALVGGLVSVYNDSKWYVSLPLFALTAFLIIVKLFSKKSIHDFEILQQVMTIDIMDKTGNKAEFTNFTLLKALTNGAQSFEYFLYSDGNVENIRTVSGSVINKVNEAGRIKVITHVEKPMKKGQTVEHALQASYINTFNQQNGFWLSTKNTPGAHIKTVILTPVDRQLKTFSAYKIVGQKKILLDNQPKRIIKSAKPGIEIDFEEVKFLEKCRLEWSW
jgi:hypothetical protein